MIKLLITNSFQLKNLIKEKYTIKKRVTFAVKLYTVRNCRIRRHLRKFSVNLQLHINTETFYHLQKTFEDGLIKIT